mmetsp:Transcript_29981/g.73809  ORF Transcript_29981/g.73809 Transcript_29981/m.73809 type:complete len:278 (+) Transcript_29981:351-1184(+)
MSLARCSPCALRYSHCFARVCATCSTASMPFSLRSNTCASNGAPASVSSSSEGISASVISAYPLSSSFIFSITARLFSKCFASNFRIAPHRCLCSSSCSASRPFRFSTQSLAFSTVRSGGVRLFRSFHMLTRLSYRMTCWLLRAPYSVSRCLGTANSGERSAAAHLATARSCRVRYHACLRSSQRFLALRSSSISRLRRRESMSAYARRLLRRRMFSLRACSSRYRSIGPGSSCATSSRTSPKVLSSFCTSAARCTSRPSVCSSNSAIHASRSFDCS